MAAKTQTQPEPAQDGAHYTEFGGFRFYTQRAKLMAEYAAGADTPLEAVLWIGFAQLCEATTYAARGAKRAEASKPQARKLAKS